MLSNDEINRTHLDDCPIKVYFYASLLKSDKIRVERVNGMSFFKISLTFIGFFYLSLASNAQPYFNLNTSVPVSENSSDLEHAWAGGHNSVQVSTIDLNLDGVDDLFVFDRVGNKTTTYINNGTANTPDYTFAPEYRPTFRMLKSWALLRDYNCDGYKDIFTSYSGGIRVYKNTSYNGWLGFELVVDGVESLFDTLDVTITVSSVDIPSIADIDGDGDLDIVTFDNSGTAMVFHKNQSMEMNSNCDSLTYVADTECWGSFEEDANSFLLTLGVSCKGVTGSSSDPQLFSVHSGSCSMTFDADGDNDMDILLSDVSFKNINLVTNGGDAQSANMTDQDPNFPSYDTKVDISLFPCPYFEDVNNDGKRDLIVSPNLQNFSEDAQSIWYYKNTGTDNAPVFEFQQENFLQSEMIEVGSGAYPTFFDIDNDGLTDMLVGNYYYYQPTGNKPGQMAYYRNNGTAQSPSFELITRDYVDISNLNLTAIVPTFGDIDDDGVPEMIIGEYEGKIHLFENSASPGQPANFSLQTPNYQSIDVGRFATPQLFDVDDDGLLDLIIGEQNGNLNYYRNTGTATDPAFTLVTDKMGNVDVRLDGSILGYSYPFMFEYENELRLVTGSESGNIFMYSDIETNITDTFTLVSNNYQEIWEGSRTSIAGNDLDNDGYTDFAIGNYAGGMTYFKGDSVFNPPLAVDEIAPEIDFDLYPNPAKDQVTIELEKTEKAVTIDVYSLSGQKVFSKQYNNAAKLQLNTSGWPQGFYMLNLSTGSGNTSKKLVILRDR